MSLATYVTVVLLGVAAVGGWCLWLLAHPIGACLRCRGNRVHKQFLGDRIVPCRGCEATGLVRRLGATVVHRTYWSIRDDARRRAHLAALEQRPTQAPPTPQHTAIEPEEQS